MSPDCVASPDEDYTVLPDEDDTASPDGDDTTPSDDVAPPDDIVGIPAAAPAPLVLGMPILQPILTALTTNTAPPPIAPPLDLSKLDLSDLDPFCPLPATPSPSPQPKTNNPRPKSAPPSTQPRGIPSLLAMPISPPQPAPDSAVLKRGQVRVMPRPQMQHQGYNQRGHWMEQLNCKTEDLCNVYIPHTRTEAWLPKSLLRDLEFREDFLSRPASRQTVMAFARVNQLNYNLIPARHYMDGLERFLAKLEHGECCIANIYSCRSPHESCRRWITNVDLGHYCLALNNRFIDHHVGDEPRKDYYP